MATPNLVWVPSNPKAWAYWDAFIDKGKNKVDRPIGSNTRVHRNSDGSIGIRLHATDIVTFYDDGRFSIDTGGWNSTVTRDRINTYSLARVYTHNHQLFIILRDPELTPPKVQKCRRCRGKGGDVVPPAGQGYKPWDWDYSDWQRTEPTGNPEWAPVQGPGTWRKCWQCYGRGRFDYGSKPIHFAWDGKPIMLDVDGTPLPDVEVPPHFNVIKPPKSHHNNAQTTPTAKPQLSVQATLQALLPALNQIHHSCPDKECEFSRLPRDLTDTIIHLNDIHKWPRERIADWLDTLDVDLSFPTPETKEIA